MDSKSFSILVVDDEEGIRSMISEVLRLEGYDCITAKDGEEAYKAICSQKIDAVISDIMMPELGGLDLLDKVKDRNPLLPHLALISGFTEASLADVYDKGAEAFLAKPFEIRSLVNLVRRLLSPMENLWKDELEENENRFLKYKFPSFKESIQDRKLLLGRGGFFLNAECLENIPTIGSQVRFHFDFEKKDHSPIYGQGTVRWIRKKEQPEYSAGVGVEFDFLDINSRADFVYDVKTSKSKAFIPKG